MERVDAAPIAPRSWWIMDERRPFTPDSLAERWGCSSETVRQMVKRGDLPGFRVGHMIRIPQWAVDAHEAGERPPEERP